MVCASMKVVEMTNIKTPKQKAKKMKRKRNKP